MVPDALRALLSPPAGGLESLRRADSLSGGGAEARDEAMSIYRALAGSIDPATAEGELRVRWLLSSRRALSPEFEDLLARAAERASDGGTRFLASIAGSQFPQRRGDFRAAEEILRRGLAEVRGSQSRREMSVCMLLSGVFRAQHREFEALILARRASRLAERLGPPAARAAALVHLGAALLAIGEHAAFDRTASALEGLLPSLEPHETVAMRRPMLAYRAESFVARGDHVAARREIAVRDSMPLEDWLRAQLGAEDAERDARMLCAEGRFEQALELVAKWHRSDGPCGVEWFEWTGVEVACRARTTGRAGLAAAAARFLDEIERNGCHLLGPGGALRLAASVGGALVRTPGQSGAAQRAYRFAAAMMLERTRELDVCIAELAELSAAMDEDCRMLADFRLRFVREHEAMLATIAESYDLPGAEPPTAFHALADSDGRLRICAWCLQVRTPDGRELPIGHYVPDSERLAVTHGICDPCAANISRA